MSDRKTRGERARLDLYYRSKAIQVSGATFVDRETLFKEGGSLEDLLFHATPQDIARLNGETALKLVNWSIDLDGWNVWPSIVWEVLEPAPKLAATEPGVSETTKAGGKKRGRPPKNWWPELAPAMTMWVYNNGLPATQAELENAMLQWLADSGHEDVGRETIRPAVARLMDLVRKEREGG